MSVDLQPTATPEILVEIPSAVAYHVLGDSTAVLGEGELALVLTRLSGVSAPPAPAPGGVSRTPVLALTVGRAAFPLFEDTVFGTLAGDQRAYVFTPEIGGERGGYVKIALPEGVLVEGSSLSELHTQFEQVLIFYGLLKEGVEAATDESRKNVRDDSANGGQGTRGSTTSHLSENSPTTSPAHVPASVATALPSSTSGTQSVVITTRRITNAVTSAAGNAGAWVAGHLSQSSPSKSQDLANAYYPDAAEATEIQGTVTDAVVGMQFHEQETHDLQDVQDIVDAEDAEFWKEVAI
ncbi:hypothetical protein BKA93DRAFT_824041 [Sparassis latifolia]